MRSTRRTRQTTRVARFELMEPRMLLSGSAPATITATWTGLSQVRAQYNFTGQGQTVAVIDTGIDYNHAALGDGLGPANEVVGGYDFADQSANPYDGGAAGGHGTEVAGVIGSRDPADLGVAPGVDLVALKVFDNSGNGSSFYVDQALQWVNANRNSFRYPITTVVLALGDGSNSETLPPGGGYEKDLAQLDADGMFIAVAAGNSFATYQQVGLSYPAVSPSVVPVAAGNIDGTICSFSQRDSRVLVAPGTNVLTTVPNYTGNGSDDNFGLYAGTSMAAPFVAGASVLMRQAYQSVGVSNVTEQMLYNEMVNSSDTIYDAATGQSYHRINIERAIDDIMATAQPAAVATPAPLQTAATVDQVMQTPTSWLPQTTTAASVSTSSTSAALPVAAPSTPATAAAPVIASSGVKSVASKLTGVTAASAPVAKVVAKPLPQIRKARMES